MATALKPISLKFQNKEQVYGNYEFIRAYPQTSAASMTMSAAGGLQVNIPLPISVFNPSMSRFNCRITVPAQGAANYIFHNINGQKLITQMSCSVNGGIDLAPVNNVDRLLDVCSRLETPHTVLEAKDTVQSFASDGTKSSEFEGLSLADANSSNIYYLNASIMQKPVKSVANVVNSPLNTAMIIDYSLLGDAFKNTFLSVNRDIFFQNQVILTLTFNGLNNLFWTSTSATNPLTGIANIAAGNTTISNISFDTAVQQNPLIVRDVEHNCRTGLEFTIPYVTQYTNNIVAGSLNFSYPITSAAGDTLTKIYVGFYPSRVVNAALTYNRSNATANPGAISTGYGAKVGSFSTTLGDTRLQKQNLNPSQGDDYNFLKPYLEGSSVSCMNDYYANWFWAERFDGLNKIFLKDIFPDLDENNLIAGYPLADKQINYNFTGNLISDSNIYVFFVTHSRVRIEGLNVYFIAR